MKLTTPTIKRHTLPEVFEKKAYYLEKTIGEAYSKSYGFTYKKTAKEIYSLFKEYKDSNYLFTAAINSQNVGFLIGNFSNQTEGYTNVMSINEISIIPEYRGLNISESIREFAIKTFSPNIIYGEANNPISVHSRRKSDAKLGYSTYWMEEDISINPHSNLINIKEISYALANAYDPEVISLYKDGCKPFTLYNDVIPDPKNNIIKDLKKLFHKINGYSKTVSPCCLGVLISIKN